MLRLQLEPCGGFFGGGGRLLLEGVMGLELLKILGALVTCKCLNKTNNCTHPSYSDIVNKIKSVWICHQCSDLKLSIDLRKADDVWVRLLFLFISIKAWCIPLTKTFNIAYINLL